MSMDAEDWDLDLCCSESSADFSPDSMQSRGSVEGEDCLVEYRVFSAVEARSELQWLLQSEARFCFCRHPAKTVETVCAFRIMLVDTLCNAAERMRMSFTTKALAISYLDRFLNSMPDQSPELLQLVAMACLSIAAKADEVCLPAHMLMTQLAACWGLPTHLGDLRKMELMVLSALGWRIQDVTAATVLDTLVCLLNFKHSSALHTGCYKQMHLIRESSKLLLAKAFRDPKFSQIRPSSLATAAVILLIDNVGDLQTDLVSFKLAIAELYSDCQSQEVVQCMLLLKSSFDITLIPSLRRCRIEVASDEGLVRVYQQKEDSVVTTPTSVLHSAQALAHQHKGRSADECCSLAKAC